ncbi:DUF2975 domain-containing protein [Adhaeribacter pallidiroseus]|uniref:DUF2975 domain-containing protein n=1 Tax=Adhaeribacter pallidiroseus TaxID=2072847 RepID=A0A369QKL3_9BACT|nr:DUF2975 domain-containing protein [Adhaeribacter pallidiroseus]RDC65441.1 hypothetical protein AHMF7616_04071 [Adhaeribacter pallidiroseus]
MKALGNYSLASFIRFIISAAWYIQLLFLIYLTFAISLKFFKNGTTEPTPETLEVRLTQGRPVEVSTRAIAENLTNASLQLDSGKLTFNHPSSKSIIGFNLLVMWVAFTISLSITYLLRQLFRSLAQNNPFVLENAQRLRIIAILIMVTSFTTFAHDAIVNWFLQQNFLLSGSGIRAHLVIDLKTLFAGLIVLVIAEIFRIGAQMKEEQELTV